MRWHEVGDAIRSANYALIALAVALLCLSLIVRALRWRVLLHPLTGIKLRNLFGSMNVGYLVNNVAPLQVGGELARAYMLSELEGISATRSLSTLFVERILDMTTLLVFLAIIAPFIDAPPWVGTTFIVIGSALTVVIALMVVASVNRALAMRVVRRALRLAPGRARPKLDEMAQSAFDGFGVLTHPRIAIQLIAWSVATWMIVALVVYAVMEAFSLDLGFNAAVFVLIATTFGWMVPASPGSVGVYEAIVIKTLTHVFGVAESNAISYALVLHLVFYLPPFPIGLTFLWMERRLWRRTNLLAKIRSLQGDLTSAETSPVARP